MFTIGDFARLGGISVRMLRHYDAIGLLRPARVDPYTGHRSYSAEQLSRLNRVVALKDLGFTLAQVAGLLDDEVGPAELRGMLRLRRAELVEQIASDRDRLSNVERRLRIIEEERTMTEHEFTLTPLPALRVAARTVVVDGLEDVKDVIQPLFAQLADALQEVGVPLQDSALGLYELPDDGPVRASAAFPLPAGAEPGAGNEARDVPAVERALVVRHVGSLDDVDRTWQALGERLERDGHRPSGAPVREVYLHMPMDDPASWVTELQWPVD